MGTPTAPPGSPGTAKSITYSTPTSSSTTSSTTNPSSLPAFTGFSIPTILYSLDGINYTTPLKGDPLIEHILSDGTVASVEYPFITINGTQVKFPDEGSSEFSLCPSILSWEICFFPRPRSSSGGGDGGDGKCGGGDGCGFLDLVCLAKRLVEAVDCAVEAATGVIDGLGDIATTVLRDAASELVEGAGVAIDGAEGFALDAASALGQVEGVLTSAGNAFERIELRCLKINDGLTAGGNLAGPEAEFAASFSSLRPLSRMGTLLSVLRNTQSVLKLMARSTSKEFQGMMRGVLRGRYRAWVGVGVAAGATTLLDHPSLIGDALTYVAKFLRQYGPVSSNIAESLMGRTLEYTESEKENRLYFIQTDMNTKFFNHVFVQLIHDGTGKKIAADEGRPSDGPCYFARLNKHIAIFAMRFPGVAYMHRQRGEAEEMVLIRQLRGDGSVMYDGPLGSGHRNSTGKQQPESNSKSARALVTVPNDWEHKRLLSEQVNARSEDQQSTWDDSLGGGATIFVVDIGFDVAGNQVNRRRSGSETGTMLTHWIFRMNTVSETNH